MSNLWDECEKLRKEINREFVNLIKSKGRPRSLEGILSKSNKLKEQSILFEAYTKKLEHRGNDETWSELVNDLVTIQFQVKESLKILDETPIIQTSCRSRKHTSTLELLKARRTSVSDEKLNTPILELKLKTRSAENLTMQNQAAYEFPMVTAIQCIPEFHGKSEELQPFFMQIDYFSNAFPENADQKPLLNVVYTKLKGEALMRLHDIQGDTWANVKLNLKNSFQLEKSIGTIIKEIETLKQSSHESYNEYKIRVKELYRFVSALPEHGNESYANTVLRKHFLAGLRSRALALTGKSQRDKTFPKLLDWLQKEIDEEEELREIHNRLQSTRMRTSQQQQSNYNRSTQANNYNYNRNNKNNRRGNNNDYREQRNNYRGNNNNYRGNKSNYRRNNINFGKKLQQLSRNSKLR
ncbi:conserved oligomeric Golgi complex subunit 3-like [Toxorhynchites rutilus septentrionalis]|uniref:conserved oligomeric Golgi complex subunit 3-like n=1 Tax=Toxorhynchites rutilus septentrionalis TaxID=329112 RepID=UPI00247AEF5A|nr:conserved oligomeric Golgi complex subunit 3-like [Toxorhynchites rutilus septentrionalis]